MSDQAVENLPKKILVIKDLAYILPEDFNGTLDDALLLLVKYKKTKHNSKKIIDKSNLTASESLLLHSDEAKVCGKYGIFELHESGYIQI